MPAVLSRLERTKTNPMRRWRISLRRTATGKLTTLRRHNARSEQGTALIETALTTVVMLTVIFGLIELCLALYTYHFVSNAAREGSRYAIVRGSDSCTNTPNLTNCNATPDEIQTWVKSVSYPAVDTSKMTVTATWLKATSSGSPATTTWSTCPGTCNGPGNMVKVVVSYSFPLNIFFLSKSTLNIGSTSEMVISQ